MVCFGININLVSQRPCRPEVWLSDSKISNALGFGSLVAEVVGEDSPICTAVGLTLDGHSPLFPPQIGDLRVGCKHRARGWSVRVVITRGAGTI